MDAKEKEAAKEILLRLLHSACPQNREEYEELLQSVADIYEIEFDYEKDLDRALRRRPPVESEP